MTNIAERLVRWIRSSVSLLLLCLLCSNIAAVEPAAWNVPQTGRIVAFGDVHGSYDELSALLRQAEIIDDESNWIGGTTQLVSLGDLFDRGPNSRQVAELLMRLQEQAPNQKGSVHVVLGNHELMLASGDLRYVSSAEYAAYVEDETAEEREFLQQQFAAVRPGVDAEILQAAFEREFPPGFSALSRSHGFDGEIGQWLLAQPLILKIGDTLFVHGGFPPELADYTLDDVNQNEKQAIAEYLELVNDLTELGILNSTIGYLNHESWLTGYIAQYKKANGRRSNPPWVKQAETLIELQQSLVYSDSGPLWYRGTATCHPYVASYDTENILNSWNAQRVVIGHTPTLTRRVTSRIRGSVIMADTGMFPGYNGRASAVIIENGDLSVMYAGEPDLQKPNEEQQTVPRQPSNFDDAALEQFLLTAEIIADEPIGTGITEPHRLTLKQGNVQFYAVYKNYDDYPGLQDSESYSRRRHDNSDRYVHDIAAYKLDRMLDLNITPVSVERVVNGEPGAVTLWLENTINERDRAEQEDEFMGQCPQYHQYRLRILYDILIWNEDRNLTNILWTDDDYRLLFIDHSRSFRTFTRPPDQYSKSTMELSELFREKLVALNEENLTEELGDYLHPRQITSLLERRDLILEQANSTSFQP